MQGGVWSVEPPRTRCLEKPLPAQSSLAGDYVSGSAPLTVPPPNPPPPRPIEHVATMCMPMGIALFMEQ